MPIQRYRPTRGFMTQRRRFRFVLGVSVLGLLLLTVSAMQESLDRGKIRHPGPVTSTIIHDIDDFGRQGIRGTSTRVSRVSGRRARHNGVVDRRLRRG